MSGSTVCRFIALALLGLCLIFTAAVAGTGDPSAALTDTEKHYCATRGEWAVIFARDRDAKVPLSTALEKLRRVMADTPAMYDNVKEVVLFVYGDSRLSSADAKLFSEQLCLIQFRTAKSSALPPNR